MAIGDIHGCDVALSTLLDGIGLTPDDTVIALGDFIDRELHRTSQAGGRSADSSP